MFHQRVLVNRLSVSNDANVPFWGLLFLRIWMKSDIEFIKRIILNLKIQCKLHIGFHKNPQKQTKQLHIENLFNILISDKIDIIIKNVYEHFSLPNIQVISFMYVLLY